MQKHNSESTFKINSTVWSKKIDCFYFIITLCNKSFSINVLHIYFDKRLNTYIMYNFFFACKGSLLVSGTCFFAHTTFLHQHQGRTADGQHQHLARCRARITTEGILRKRRVQVSKPILNLLFTSRLHRPANNKAARDTYLRATALLPIVETRVVAKSSCCESPTHLPRLPLLGIVIINPVNALLAV